MEIIRAEERGLSKAGWLTSYHTFSFNRYHDPERMGFRKIRVFNDDWIAKGKGFGEHMHSDMEIITFVLKGEVEHKDSSGGGGILGFSEVQVMSAGSGIVHSEFNHSEKEDLELFQIWILTKKAGIKPRYEQKKLDFEKNKLNKICGGKKTDPLFISQDAEMFYGDYEKGRKLKLGKDTLFFVIDGKAKSEGFSLDKRDTLLCTEDVEIVFLEKTRFLTIVS